MKMLPIVSIVGRPNVGKSTLFNRLVGKRQAIVSREAGTTRDSITGEVYWGNKKFLLVDTAGLILDFYGFKEAEIEKKAQEKIADALESSDIVLFVVDVKEGIVPEDEEVARLIRKYNKNVMVVANKADNPDLEKKAQELEKMGFENIFAISSQSGRRTGALLDVVTKGFSDVTEVDQTKRITIIGRANAGKSTLFNALIGSDVAIVSDVPGTTRDAIKFKITLKGYEKEAEIIDTAGFRKQGKIAPGVEKFSIMRAIESIYRSDLVLLVVDSEVGLSRIDAHLAQMALDSRKKIIIVLNKIDKLADESTDEIANFYRFKFLLKQKIVGISAKDKKNLHLLAREIAEVI
jgi:GTP-binding protein